jgi:hypothetical protein
MMQNYKYFILSTLLSLWVTLSCAQTPQLHFILETNETGAAKSYVARNYITLKPNFRYTASANQSFSARIDKTIDIKLPDGTVVKPDGATVKPDGTMLKPDGTIIKPDGTLIRPDGTIFKINGEIINSDGTVAPNVSQIVPSVWFKTMPVTADINGRYKWKDFSPNNISLIKYSTNGTVTEYTVGRDSIMNYNFNPAIDLSAGNISKEIVIKKSNLTRATIIGIWGTKKEVSNSNNFIFALNGRRDESIVFSKSNVYSSVESGKETLEYGNDLAKNLLCQPNSNISANKARESSLRIVSYCKSNMPNTSIWGEQQKASISLGSSFQNSNTNNTSNFSPTLNNFEGFKGYTPELLVFETVLLPVERDIFESYLAIKYGVSMDKSYLSGIGRVIWDYSSNELYNNRITGYGREDLIGLNQKMSTTSYQEAPYYSDSCDSYQTNTINGLSSRNRLLVMGCQKDSPINDGEYVLFGDDNNPISATNTSLAGFVTMQRKWLVSTNRPFKNEIELSYFNSLATGFINHQYETYLIVDRTGSGVFNSSSDVYLMDSLDTNRSKIIFKNVVWDKDRKNAFTFGYKVANRVKKKNTNIEPTSLDTLNPMSDLRIYYTDPHDMSSVTVKLQTSKPTTSVIQVFDMSGRIILRQNLPESSNVQFTNIKFPRSGIYLINVINNEIRYTQKVISRN